MSKPVMDQSGFRNFLGDDISWKTLYATQNKIFETREEALSEAIKWCSRIDVNLLIEHLKRS